MELKLSLTTLLKLPLEQIDYACVEDLEPAEGSILLHLWDQLADDASGYHVQFGAEMFPSEL
jgi:hypothetical protein